jgi:hydroxymethylbilane synthase
LVAGGGKTALRKISTLLGCGARVKVVAPEGAPELADMVSDGRVVWEKRRVREDDFKTHSFAVLAAPPEISGELLLMARAAGCAAAVCASGADGDFALCAQAALDGCVVGVSSGGGDPSRAAALKRNILKTFGEPMTLLTRKSPLAAAQAALWTDALESAGFRTSLRFVESHGDRDRNRELSSFGFGAFVKALEEELLRGGGDCAVHSAKDVPAVPAEGCSLSAVLKRGSVRDVLVTRDGTELDALPPGAVVGTSSMRRRAQILYARPDLVCVKCRGNVDTRIGKLSSGEVDALVLAEAGLDRLGLPARSAPLPFVTSAGQGAVAAETLTDSPAEKILRQLNHLPTWYEVTAEREFLSRLAFGCVCPVGVNAVYSGGKLEMSAEIYPERGAPDRASVSGRAASAEDAAALAGELWDAMRGCPAARAITEGAAR